MQVIYLAGAAFKSNIGLRKFWSQLVKFGHSCPNYINFQFLIKFCRYSILKAMILNHTFIFKIWTQIPKFGYFGPKIIDFLILTKFYLHPIFKYDICFRKCQAHMPKKISNEIWNEMKWKGIKCLILIKLFYIYLNLTWWFQLLHSSLYPQMWEWWDETN